MTEIAHITLAELLMSQNETIRRNAMSILKQLQKQKKSSFNRRKQ